MRIGFKLSRRSVWPPALNSVFLSVVLPGVLGLPTSFAANFGAASVSPDQTIVVTASNLNGWQNSGFLDWSSDNTNPGAKGAYGNLTGDSSTGYWEHRAIYDAIPNYASNNYFELAYAGPEIQGQLVSNWHGFEYRNQQLSAGSTAHAVVLFEIDTDGNLGTTADTEYLRFQPGFLANFTTPVAEWNTYGVQGQLTNFLDATNASNTLSRSYQSINDLFQSVGTKSNSGVSGTPIVLPSTAVFRSVIIAGGFQGFAVIDEQIDYLQMTFDTDPSAGLSFLTTRFDFGEIEQIIPPAPEPSSLALAMIGLAGLSSRARRARASN